VNCGSKEVDCLHLLIAITRVRCEANRLLQKTGLELSSLRNTALSYYLGGSMPRKLQVGRLHPARALRSPAPGGPVAAAPALGAPPTAPAEAGSRVHAGDIVQASEDEPPPPAETPITHSASNGFSLDPKHFPLLYTLGRNLSAAAQAQKLDPV